MKLNEEQVLIEIMRYLGPKATSCRNCKAGKEPNSKLCACQCCYEAVCHEVSEVLQVVHKYLGKKKVAKIYKELGYKWGK